MKKSKVYALCEGAIMVALATALSYVKLMELPQGGSVCIGMLPLFIYFYPLGLEAQLPCRVCLRSAPADL